MLRREDIADWLVAALTRVTPSGLAVAPGEGLVFDSRASDGQHVVVITSSDALELHWSARDGDDMVQVAIDGETAVRLARFVLLRWWLLGLHAWRLRLWGWALRNRSSNRARATGS